VVIGCAALASGRRLELVGYQLGRGDQSSLCIDHYDFETGVSSGAAATSSAAAARSTRRAPRAPPGDRPSYRAPPLLRLRGSSFAPRSAGASAARPRPRQGSRSRRSAHHRHRRSVWALSRRRPRAVARSPAEALGTGDRTLGLAFFEGFRGAIGKGRAHADLVPTRPKREGGRRVVTLPVRFTRRGAAGGAPRRGRSWSG
jgi:hypothetical protein